ncbi:hypothetical protein PCE1_000464 [Barthelona sp. PCE]
MPTIVEHDDSVNELNAVPLNFSIDKRMTYNNSMSSNGRYLVIRQDEFIVFEYSEENKCYEKLSSINCDKDVVWCFMTNDGYVVLGDHYSNNVYDGISGKLTVETDMYGFEEEAYGLCVSNTLVNGYICAAGMCGELLIMQCLLEDETCRLSVMTEDVFCTESGSDDAPETGYSSVHIAEDNRHVFGLSDENQVYVYCIDTEEMIVRQVDTSVDGCFVSGSVDTGFWLSSYNCKTLYYIDPEFNFGTCIERENAKFVTYNKDYTHGKYVIDGNIVTIDLNSSEQVSVVPIGVEGHRCIDGSIYYCVDGVSYIVRCGF